MSMRRMSETAAFRRSRLRTKSSSIDSIDENESWTEPSFGCESDPGSRNRSTAFRAKQTARAIANAASAVEKDKQVECGRRLNIAPDLLDALEAVAEELRDQQGQLDDLRTYSESVMTKAKMQYDETYGFEQRVKDYVRVIFEKLEFSLNEVRNDQISYARKRDDKDMHVNLRLEQLCTLCENVTETWRSQAIEQGADEEQIQRLAQAHAQITSMQADFTTHQVEVLTLRNKIQDLEAKVIAVPHTPEKHTEAYPLIESLEQLEKVSRLEHRLDELSELIDQETLAREVLAERLKMMFRTEHSKLAAIVNARASPGVSGEAVLAQIGGADTLELILEAERTKTADLVTQKMGSLRLELEPMLRDLKERISKESLERAAHLEEFRITHVKHVREAEANHRKLEDTVLTCMRDTKREVVEALQAEKSEREENEANIERQLDWLGETQDVMQNMAAHRWPRKTALTTKPLSLIAP